MHKKLWEASLSQKKNSNLAHFEKFLNQNLNLKESTILKNCLTGALENQIYFGVLFGTFPKLRALNQKDIKKQKNLSIINFY